jgi:TP901 family phage tail tape measure protein
MARGKGTLRVVIAGDAGPLKKTLGSATGMIGKFAVGAGAAVGAALVFSVKAFADFDQAMTESTAIMGNVSDAMRKDMSDAAREVAKTTKFSATEAAESYFFLASAGLDAKQSIEALPRVAAFAQAGNFDMAQATDLLTDAQSALGLASDDAAQHLENMVRASDVLVKANVLANASVQQFSEALTSKAGAAMRSLNMDMEEGVAVLAVFADQGIKGSEAGTTFNAVIRGLTDGVRRNADVWKEHGIAVFDADGGMRNMADIVADMETALGGMSVEQQRTILSQLGFTEETLAGTLALLGNSDALREYEEELRKAGGTTDEVADKQLQTFWAQLGLLKDQLIDVGLTIGEALMPHLMSLVAWAQEKMPAIEEFITEGLASMEQWWGEHGEKVMKVAAETWEFLSDLFGDSLKTLEGLLDIWTGIMEDDWGTFWDGVEKLSEAGWNNISVTSSDAMNEISFGFAVGFVKFRGEVRRRWNELLLWIGRLPGRIVDFFAGLPGRMASVGWDIVAGLARGFGSRFAQFKRDAEVAAAGFVAGIKSALGIGSPSKVMADQVGVPIVQGIEMGMQSRLSHLQQMSNQVGNQILRDLGKYQELHDSKWRTLRRSGVMQGMSRDEFFDTYAGTPEKRALLRQTGRASSGDGQGVIVQVVNQGVIGSQRELENWLTRSLENLRRRGRLPASV